MSRVFGVSIAASFALGLVGLAGLAIAEPAGDAAKGAVIFTDQCSGCHEAKADLMGPHLGGVVGRKAGGVAGFSYTDALKNSGLTWTPDKLDQFLADPGKMVPGTAMPAAISDPTERRNVIAYLATLSETGK
jgi:cytochrome c